MGQFERKLRGISAGLAAKDHKQNAHPFNVQNTTDGIASIYEQNFPFLEYLQVFRGVGVTSLAGAMSI